MFKHFRFKLHLRLVCDCCFNLQLIRMSVIYKIFKIELNQIKSELREKGVFKKLRDHFFVLIDLSEQMIDERRG